MKVLLINPPYQTLTSNLGVGHQVPLGLLMVGGSLIDAGFDVRLLDAECGHLSIAAIVEQVRRWKPQVVMTGHAGSTPAHPMCARMLAAIKDACPRVLTVYGGVFPTYHARQILLRERAIDLIVRGEGEATARDVLTEYSRGGLSSLAEVSGVTYRRADGRIVLTSDRESIRNLDRYRTGWELIENWDAYQCFGLGRAAIVQFSRGCPHRCTYCGQHGFWESWRHRDPEKLVNEIERLCDVHGVRFVTLADENLTTSQPLWTELLSELARRRLPVKFFATIRASDIVRDRAILELYRDAGILYVLMGIDATDDAVLRRIRKASNTRIDLEACRLLKQHEIFSILGHVVGLEGRLPISLRHVLEYDDDYLNAMYATPHSWTPFGRSTLRNVIEPDQRKWDYRHQVLAHPRLRPWQLFLAVKWMELCFHLRPRRVWSILCERRPMRRRQLLWCTLHIGLVWVGEIGEFVIDACCARRRRRRRRINSAPSPVPDDSPRTALVELQVARVDRRWAGTTALRSD